MLHIEGFDEVVSSDFPDETDSRQSFDERWAFELHVLFMDVYVGHMWIDHAEEEGVIQQFTWLVPCSHISLSTGE